MYLDTVFTYVYIHNYIQLIGKEKTINWGTWEKITEKLGEGQKKG